MDCLLYRCGFAVTVTDSYRRPSQRMDLDRHTLVFIGGLHRSGTTPMARCIAEHHQVSGFRGTGVEEDEGQHLQTVYPPARMRGGPGRFALSERSHLTEASPLATPENAQRLLSEWGAHWDLRRRILLEKSPPNLLMTRFLQQLFPAARFIIVVRNPVIVALSTKKWARWQSFESLLENWFRAHDMFRADAAYLRHLHVVKYEHFVTEPGQTIKEVAEFLELAGEIPAQAVQSHRSRAYEKTWQEFRHSARPWRRLRFRRLCERFEESARRYGYSVRDLDRCDPFPG